MNPSSGVSTPDLARLYLAFRQAKLTVYYERRGTELLKLARYEDQLSSNLQRLERLLAENGGWFSQVNLGDLWLVPKGVRESGQSSDKGIVRIGTPSSFPSRDLNVQVRLSPDPDFLIVEVLYLLKFGVVLECLLPKESLGYRLDVRRQNLYRSQRYLFEYWPPTYEKFREEPLAAARTALEEGEESVAIISADFASYYDSIHPAFLISKPFLSRLETIAAWHGVPIDLEEYVQATRSLIAAFKRYTKLAGALTQSEWDSGIPIGSLTSRIVANLALETFDHSILAKPDLLCYRRYVDDFVLVVRGTSEELDVSKVLSKYLPLKAAGEDQSYVLSGRKLQRARCEFRLQKRKLRIHELRGSKGVDFVNAVANDFLRLVSEQRAFLDESAFEKNALKHLVRAGGDGSSPLRVLRDADRTKLELFALSTSLGSLERIALLAQGGEATLLIRRTIDGIIRALDEDIDWVQNHDVCFRLLRLAITARDWKSCADIVRILDQLWGGDDNLQSKISGLYHREQKLASPSTQQWAALRMYFQTRRLDAICSVLPLDIESDFSLAFPGGGLRFGDKLLSRRELLEKACLLVRSDLRRWDREDEFLRGGGETVPQDWTVPTLQDPDLLERFAKIQEFIDLCVQLGDRCWSLSPARLFLSTRPPSYLDVSRRFLYRVEAQGFESNVFEELYHTVNALRATRYAEPVGLVLDGRTVAVGSAVSKDDIKPPENPHLLLGNLVMPMEYFNGAVKKVAGSSVGEPVLTLTRLRSLATIIARAETAARSLKEQCLLVLPELSVPRRWFRALALHVVKSGRLGLLTGLEYLHDVQRNVVMNQAVIVVPGPFHTAAAWPWTKRFPAVAEQKELDKYSLTFPTHEESPPRVVVKTGWGDLSVLICSEMIESTRVSDLMGRVEVVVCPAWNSDTSSFDHLVQSVGLQLNCVLAIANNGQFSDCRAWAPRKTTHEREQGRLIQRKMNAIAVIRIPLASLREFRQSGGDDWKPLPPDWPKAPRP